MEDVNRSWITVCHCVYRCVSLCVSLCITVWRTHKRPECDHKLDPHAAKLVHHRFGVRPAFLFHLPIAHFVPVKPVYPVARTRTVSDTSHTRAGARADKVLVRTNDDHGYWQTALHISSGHV